MDLRDEVTRSSLAVDEAELAAPWALDVAEGRIPASWRVAERLSQAGAAGLIVRSFARLATPDLFNLVLWRWTDVLPHRVVAFDPDGRLGAAAPSGRPARSGR